MNTHQEETLRHVIGFFKSIDLEAKVEPTENPSAGDFIINRKYSVLVKVLDADKNSASFQVNLNPKCPLMTCTATRMLVFCKKGIAYSVNLKKLKDDMDAYSFDEKDLVTKLYGNKVRLATIHVSSQLFLSCVTKTTLVESMWLPSDVCPEEEEMYKGIYDKARDELLYQEQKVRVAETHSFKENQKLAPKSEPDQQTQFTPFKKDDDSHCDSPEVMAANVAKYKAMIADDRSYLKYLDSDIDKQQDFKKYLYECDDTINQPEER